MCCCSVEYSSSADGSVALLRRSSDFCIQDGNVAFDKSRLGVRLCVGDQCGSPFALLRCCKLARLLNWIKNSVCISC